LRPLTNTKHETPNSEQIVSKAFTREDDDGPERRSPPRSIPAPPASGRNYLTPAGAKRLHAELERLDKYTSGASSEAAAETAALGEMADARTRAAHLRRTLLNATVLPAPPPPWDTVRFGAIVTVRDADGTEARHHIVGPDEADGESDRVSCLSPLARTLLNARVGARVTLRLPAGPREMLLLSVRYEE
jgi:transcription elongation factor GreB